MARTKKNSLERKAHLAQLEVAVALAKSGDDSALRALTLGGTRYVAECMADDSASHGPAGRSRKFSNPLFMTPTGYLAAFPEKDEHLFLYADTAFDAIQKFGKPEHNTAWQVTSTTLEKELLGKRYLRWLKEVKNLDGAYTEPRRTLEEHAQIYGAGGIAALRATYTKAHAFKTEHRLLEAGLGKRRAPRPNA